MKAGITRNALAALESKPLPDPHLSTLLSLMVVYRVVSIEALLGTTPSVLLAHEWRSRGWAGGRPSNDDPL